MLEKYPNGVISFSGGKDSTTMLLMMIEREVPFDKIVLVDTTKEFPQMYEHIERVRKYISPHEIEVVKIPFDYWFGEHIKTKGKNKGSRGYGWPDFRNRWCTALKREAVKQTIGDSLQYHGIAYDEKERAEKNKFLNVKYPLIEWKVTEEDALNYCYERGFDWGGLYEKFNRVSCYNCPLARMGELRTLYHEYPELWEEMVEADKLSFRKFRSDYTLSELTERFAEGR